MQGDNQYRISGQALEFKQLNIHAWEAFDKGQDKVIKEKLKLKTKDTIMEKYDDAATEEELPMELLLGQSERQVEYDCAGRVIKGMLRI